MNATTSLSFSKTRSTTRIGLTPLIDVVFMLLLFFMLATSFDQWRSIRLVTASDASTPSRTGQQSLLLMIYPERIEINGQSTALDQVRNKLESFAQDAELVVKPMADTRLQRVVNVMDQLRMQGIANPVLSVD